VSLRTARSDHYASPIGACFQTHFIFGPIGSKTDARPPLEMPHGSIFLVKIQPTNELASETGVQVSNYPSLASNAMGDRGSMQLQIPAVDAWLACFETPHAHVTRPTHALLSWPWRSTCENFPCSAHE
jgi:hypothetical protein